MTRMIGPLSRMNEMASCPKCGRKKVTKRKDGRRSCKTCGFLPGVAGFNRSGVKVSRLGFPFNVRENHGESSEEICEESQEGEVQRDGARRIWWREGSGPSGQIQDDWS